MQRGRHQLTLLPARHLPHLRLPLEGGLQRGADNPVGMLLLRHPAVPHVREDTELWDRWSSCCCDAWGGSSYKAKWVVVPDGEPGKGGVRRTAFYEEMCATIPKDCRIVAGGGSAAAVAPCEQMERGEPGA